MSFWDLFFIAVGLSMDAFAVSVCKGLASPQLKLKTALLCGLYFGIFQALMPAAGYALGSRFSDAIAAFDHWIAFILLAVIGGNMIRESLKGEDDEPNVSEDAEDVKTMLLLAVATSIDALAVGVSFAFLRVNILYSASFIGCVTFTLSFAGVCLGRLVGKEFSDRAGCLGGAILIFIGLRILITHLFFGG